MQLFANPKRSDQISQLVMDVINNHSFDGIVLEVWSQLGGQAKPQLTKLIQNIGDKIRRQDKTFVLVIPPPVYSGNRSGMFDAEDFDNLVDFVDYFSLMTYDYSSPARPVPNAHLGWMK